MNLPITFGDIIRMRREAKRLTQKELAKCCEISDMYVSQIEAGQRIPRSRICFLIAQVLEIDARELLLFAYQAKVSEEIRDILFPVLTTYEKIVRLAQITNLLPNHKRDHVINIVEASIRLLDINELS